MSSWIPTKYRTLNWAEYNLSLKQRGSLSIWFDPQMAWEAEASGLRGRQQTYSDAAIQACLTLKVLFSLPLRQTTGFVESLLRLGVLQRTVHTIRANATMPLRHAMPLPSYRRAKTPNFGSLTRPARGRETKRFDPKSI